MAKPEHLEILKRGVDVWNKWRGENPNLLPDLTEANLYGKNLGDIDFFHTDLSKADLRGTYLGSATHSAANLMEAKLWGAHLSKANLAGAQLIGAELRNANLEAADLRVANLNRADLFNANLANAILGRLDAGGMNGQRFITSLQDADLTGCRVYGISAWDVKTKGAKQSNLVITNLGQPTITVDNLEVAQFIYLLLNSDKIRHVIDAITSKAVLILGRFTKERKAVLDSIREELRKHDYLPILFDFEKPASRDITETVSILAHMSRFIVADITDAKSIPQELQRIVPNLPSVPVKPILLKSETEYGMFEHFRKYPWVLEVYLYDDQKELVTSLHEKVISPAEEKALKLQDTTLR